MSLGVQESSTCRIVVTLHCRPYIGPDAAAYHFKSQRSPTLVAVPVGYKTHAAIRGCSFAFSTGIGPAGPVYHAQRRLRPDEPDADRHAGYAAASVQLQWTCSSPSELLVAAAAHVAQIANGEEASQMRFSVRRSRPAWHFSAVVHDPQL